MYLETKLCDTEKQTDVNVKNQNLERSLSFKDKLENTCKNEAKGAGVRACARWMEEGEKSTKYFQDQKKVMGRKKR